MSCVLIEIVSDEISRISTSNENELHDLLSIFRGQNKSKRDEARILVCILINYSEAMGDSKSEVIVVAILFKPGLAWFISYHITNKL